MDDAFAVLLPVAGALRAERWLREALRRGTCAVLLGETRREYVAREMSARRRASERADDLRAFTADLGPVLVAVDQEPWGIQRLHGLVPEFPDPAGRSGEDIAASAAEVAEAARACGVTMFLSPVLDLLSGPNPWLEGRTLQLPAAEVARIAAAFVRGVQRAGVLSAAKHFPGHPRLAADPAVAQTSLTEWDESALEPFRAVVDAGVGAVMTGPVPVDAFHPGEPASTSDKTVSALRNDLGFTGLVVSDDLDAPATLAGRTLPETAIASLAAGVDLLLLPGGEHVLAVGEAIAAAAASDPRFARRLADAAGRVRRAAGG